MNVTFVDELAGVPVIPPPAYRDSPERRKTEIRCAIALLKSKLESLEKELSELEK